MGTSNQVPDAAPEAADRLDEPVSAPANGREKWLPQFWANPRHVGLRFASEDELDAAIEWLWTVPELRDLPRVHVGDNTMIVPAGAVELFREKGYRFTLSRVVSAGDLPAEEVNRIRREG